MKAKFFVFIVAGVFLVGATYMSARAYLIKKAEIVAQGIINQTPISNDFEFPDSEVMALTQGVFGVFHEREPKESMLLRLRPYLTNKRLPASIRLPEGVIETIVQGGMCDNAARFLKFVLAQKKYSSVQWNMVGKSSAHSALSVTMPDARDVFVDPFYGFVATLDRRLISAGQAQNQARQGRPVHTIFQSLGTGSRSEFYKEFKDVRMSAEGSPLHIAIKLPRVKNVESITIGQIDGRDVDVKDASARFGLTPYWHYMGHLYNREWVRSFEAQEDVRVKLLLVDFPDPSVLIANPPPAIEGKSLTWVLNSGDVVTFTDGNARLSMQRMNSYIGVDQIVIMPVLLH